MIKKLKFIVALILGIIACTGMWSCSDADDDLDMTPEQLLMWGCKSGVQSVTSGGCDIYFKSYRCKRESYTDILECNESDDPANTLCTHHSGGGILFKDGEPYLVSSYVYTYLYFNYDRYLSSESIWWIRWALTSAKSQPSNNLLKTPILKKIAWNSDKRNPVLYHCYEEGEDNSDYSSLDICTFTDNFLITKEPIGSRRAHFLFYKAADINEITPEAVIIENRFQYFSNFIDVLEMIFPDKQVEEYGIDLDRLRQAIEADLTYGPDNERARRIITGFSAE